MSWEELVANKIGQGNEWRKGASGCMSQTQQKASKSSDLDHWAAKVNANMPHSLGHSGHAAQWLKVLAMHHVMSTAPQARRFLSRLVNSTSHKHTLHTAPYTAGSLHHIPALTSAPVTFQYLPVFNFAIYQEMNVHTFCIPLPPTPVTYPIRSQHVSTSSSH